MTQRTIVTTHIPRPPLMLPYNSYLMHHLMRQEQQEDPYGLLSRLYGGRGRMPEGLEEEAPEQDDDEGQWDCWFKSRFLSAGCL